VVLKFEFLNGNIVKVVIVSQGSLFSLNVYCGVSFLVIIFSYGDLQDGVAKDR